MDNKISRNLLMDKLNSGIIAVEKLPKIEFYGLLLISIMFVGIFSVSSVMSALTNSISIPSSGTITAISTLHVDGKYIKNAYNGTVILKGVNKVEFADQPGGTWMGRAVMDYSSWRPSDVRSELAKMKEWGINTIRTHQAVENWKFDLGQHKQIIKEFLDIAAQYGMYVIYDGYSVRNYWHGGQQDPLPYPPYQTSANASVVITSENDFVDYWVSVATELKNYSNVIFELWNEPHGDNTAKQSWFNVTQRTITAIRATGATQLIVVQWNYGVWVNLDFPPPNNPGATMDWIWQANFTDPLGNLVYSTHMYRNGGAFQHSKPTYWNAWNYSEIQQAFQYYKFPQVVASYPLIIGEIGADLAYTGDELQHELTAFDNCFKLFDEMGIHYTAFWWRNIGVFRLNDGSPNFNPNAAGQILKTHLLG
jgi:hypothetical protein